MKSGKILPPYDKWQPDNSTVSKLPNILSCWGVAQPYQNTVAGGAEQAKHNTETYIQLSGEKS
jgi:hypothetical protein